MKTLAYLLSIVLCCYAIPQDLRGRVFTFPQQTANSYTRLYPQLEKIFFSSSVCFRFFTDDLSTICPFSLSIPGKSNSLTIFLHNDKIEFWVGDKLVYFNRMAAELNEWNSVCATWDSGTGLVQVWLNGRPSVRKALHAGGSISGTPFLVLGQDQDSHGGSFDAQQSFTGQLTDVHMWDYVLSPCEVQTYTQAGAFRPGNVLDWGAMEYTRHGYVVLERLQTLDTCRMGSLSNKASPEDSVSIPELNVNTHDVPEHSQDNLIPEQSGFENDIPIPSGDGTNPKLSEDMKMTV
ncbi:serum amyloid P-component-like [Osmerus mordax]|uniref:serum amyloid P-component-like n=1 Tax=Osmerus mordax TaxID=8014 RepID=UPI00350EDCBF